MPSIVTHQPRPVPAFRRQHSASIPNLSQSSLSFPSTMDLHHRSYRPNRPPQFPSSNRHHVPHSHHPFYRSTMAATVHTTPPLSSSYPLVSSPTENSYQNTPSMSADIQHEYPFDLGFTTSSSMSFSDLDLSQSAFLNPG